MLAVGSLLLSPGMSGNQQCLAMCDTGVGTAGQYLTTADEDEFRQYTLPQS